MRSPLKKRFAFRKDLTNQIVMYEHQNAASDVDQLSGAAVIILWKCAWVNHLFTTCLGEKLL